MMRLTLRTLLAYLDDVLAPTDTKIIGEKIQESPMAQLLVSRIREVMRRRRLKSPEVFGPEMGMDPNIVSQYLDNTLPADRYADVERVLLASDEMLAEAAACHQILTVVLADPSEVPMASRERLYALGPVDAGSQLKSVMDAARGGPKRTPAHAINTRNGTASKSDPKVSIPNDDDERITTVPDYLKRTPLSQRLLPSLVVVILVLACGFLLFPDLLKGLGQVKNEIKRKDARNADRAKNAVDDGDELVAMNDPQPGKIERGDKSETRIATPPVNINRSPIPVGIDPMPPEDEPEESPVPPPAPVAITKPKLGETPNEVDVAENASNDPEANVAATADKKTPPIVESEKPVSVDYTSNEGVVIRFDDARKHWLMIPRRSSLKSGETIANVEPFESTLDYDGGKLKLTMIGESIFRILNPAESGVNGLGIGRGHLIIQAGRTENERPMKIGLSIGDDIWTLELADADSMCALEIVPREVNQFQKLQDYHWYQATLYVLSGSVKWTNRVNQSEEVGDHMALNIVPEKDAIVRSTPISFSTAPIWTDREKRRLALTRRQQFIVQFEKAFELNQPVEETMLLLVQSTPKPKIAEFATQCLADNR